MTGFRPATLAKSVLKNEALPMSFIGCPVQGFLGHSVRYLLPRLSAVLSPGVEVTPSVAG